MTIVIGTLLGMVSRYFGGAVDMIVMRFTDVIMTFLGVVIILTVATFPGPNILNVIALSDTYSAKHCGSVAGLGHVRPQ